MEAPMKELWLNGEFGLQTAEMQSGGKSGPSGQDTVKVKIPKVDHSTVKKMIPAYESVRARGQVVITPNFEIDGVGIAAVKPKNHREASHHFMISMGKWDDASR